MLKIYELLNLFQGKRFLNSKKKVSKLSKYLQDTKIRHQIYSDIANGKETSTVSNPLTNKKVILMIN